VKDPGRLFGLRLYWVRICNYDGTVWFRFVK